MAKKKSVKRSVGSNSNKVKNTRNKGVSEGVAIVCLILNILILPGLGSLIGGKIKQGVWQLVLLIGGALVGILLTITIILAPIGIPILIVFPLSAWIWGIVTGAKLIRESH